MQTRTIADILDSSVVSKMDTGIIELCRLEAWCTDEMFLKRYAELHKEKFGVPFNPPYEDK